MHAVVGRRKTKVGRGFSLLEVNIAAFIFITVVILMIGVWALYHSALTKSKNMLSATSLARSVLEQRTSQGYTALDSLVGQPATVTTYVSHSQTRGRKQDVVFTATFRVTENLAEHFRRLTVQVDWEEDSGKKSINYETMLFRTK